MRVSSKSILVIKILSNVLAAGFFTSVPVIYFTNSNASAFTIAVYVGVIISVAGLLASLIILRHHRQYERLNAEQQDTIETLLSSLKESQRLSTLGELSAGVAHELNNPLGGIVVYSHLLLEDTESSDPRYKNIEKIIRESDRCKSIIKSLLDYARQSHPVFDNVDVNRVVIEAMSNLQSEPIFRECNITKNLSDNLPEARADASQIQEVFENIIRNAAEEMNGAGELIITSRIHGNVTSDDEYVEILFQDNGPGISAEHVEHIFDPFYTTKIKGHGTGLGLAVSYGIIERHNGKISVQNSPTGGAVFAVCLPFRGENQ